MDSCFRYLQDLSQWQSVTDRRLAVGLVGGMMAASGKSGFLGALVAGFLAGYIIVLGLRKVCDKLPDALEKIAPVLIYPLVGILLIGTCNDVCSRANHGWNQYRPE